MAFAIFSTSSAAALGAMVYDKELIDLNDVGMPNTRNGFRFTSNSREHHFIGVQIAFQSLDRYQSLQLRIPELAKLINEKSGRLEDYIMGESSDWATLAKHEYFPCHFAQKLDHHSQVQRLVRFCSRRQETKATLARSQNPKS